MKYYVPLFKKFSGFLICVIIFFQFLIHCALPLIQDQNDSASYYMNVYYLFTGKFIVEGMYPSFTHPARAYPFLGYSFLLAVCKLYSLLLHIKWATIVKWLQFAFYVITGINLSRISRYVMNVSTARLIFLLYLLYYPYFKFSHLVMSETYALFILTTCVLLFLKSFKSPSVKKTIIFYALSGHLLLIKPVFAAIVLLFICMHWLLILRKRKSLLLATIFALMIFPGIQMILSEKYYGDARISTGYGRNIWNRVIAHDKLIPVNSDELIRLQHIFESHGEKIPFGPWWNVTERLSHFGYTEDETIRICARISYDGIDENKTAYILNTFSNAYTNYRLGSVNGNIYCTPSDYESAIRSFAYDSNHEPLTNELLKQNYVNKYHLFFQQLNCDWARLSELIYFLYHNPIVIYLFLASGIFWFIRLLRNQTEMLSIAAFTVWWCGFVIVFGSNLAEFPQSRFIMPAVMFVVISVFALIIQLMVNFRLEK